MKSPGSAILQLGPLRLFCLGFGIQAEGIQVQGCAFRHMSTQRAWPAACEHFKICGSLARNWGFPAYPQNVQGKIRVILWDINRPSSSFLGRSNGKSYSLKTAPSMALRILSLGEPRFRSRLRGTFQKV